MYALTLLTLILGLAAGAALMTPSAQEDAADMLGEAAAANFLTFREAAVRAFQAESVTDAAGGTVRPAALSQAQVRAYLPSGYLFMGDWQVLVEGSVLYVHGLDITGSNLRLSAVQAKALAGRSVSLGTRVGSVLKPGDTALPASIPEGSVVAIAR
ncbi:MAG: hypothetical protein Q4F72_12710 [Desulfovibrionaceae bacterium]|nr:hypothetical protein [Desulfovibrionaceae bacterium]